MRRFISFLLILSLIFTGIMITGCQKTDDLTPKIDEKTTAYRIDLIDSANSITSQDKAHDLLVDWAEKKGIKYSTDSYGNVIMKKSASPEYKDAPPTVIVCPYGSTQFTSYIDAITSALYIIKNNEDTGNLTVVFTSDNNHSFEGIKNLDKRYFTNKSNVFCLSSGRRNIWSANTASSSTYEFSSKAAYTKPSLEKAFRIEISGLPGGIPDSKISSYPNPIKELGDLLAQFKASSMIYELSGINGGESSSLYPARASMTIVVAEDDMDKFKEKMDSSIEDYIYECEDEYPEVSYTYKEIKRPRRVLKEKYLNNYVSLLYTLIDGVYYRNDDSVVAISNIGKIRTDADKISILACGNSIDKVKLREITTSYKTLCGLSDIDFKENAKIPLWNDNADSDFANSIINSYNEYCGKDLRISTCVSAGAASFVHRKNRTCNIINVVVNEDNIQCYTGTIIKFLISQITT